MQSSFRGSPASFSNQSAALERQCIDRFWEPLESHYRSRARLWEEEWLSASASRTCNVSALPIGLCAATQLLCEPVRL